MKELKKPNYYNKIWQTYTALLPMKTVGVMKGHFCFRSGEKT